MPYAKQKFSQTIKYINISKKKEPTERLDDNSNYATGRFMWLVIFEILICHCICYFFLMKILLRLKTKEKTKLNKNVI